MRSRPATSPDGASEPQTTSRKGALEDVEAQNILAEEKIQDLEARLAEAREESRRNAEELQERPGEPRPALRPRTPAQGGHCALQRKRAREDGSLHLEGLRPPEGPRGPRRREPQGNRRSRSSGATWPGAATSPTRPKASKNPGSTSRAPAKTPPKSRRPAGTPTPGWTPRDA